ncbi:hypothetical protein JW977_03995 [Candidatus Falkowbacteria bacterium]|nr:hypothetical protein [Candidatus Falkowbacteria bacterium]
MNNIYKICLGLGMFFSAISIAWAGLDYDAIRNYFLINSDVFVQGSNSQVVIGTKFDKIGSLAVSHNLIFFDPTSKYTNAGTTKMQQGTINASSINLSAANFVLSSLTGFDPLVVNGDMSVNGNFFIRNSGIGTTDKIAPPKAIHVNSVSITTLKTSSDPYTVPKGTTIRETGSPYVNSKSNSLTYDDDGKPYCQVVTWGNGDDWGNEYRNNGIMDTKSNACDMNQTIPYTSQPSCCPNKYFVLSSTSTYGNKDGNQSAFAASQGVMICCRSQNQ